MPKLAGNITIDLGKRMVLIDGQEFPWAIAEDGPSATHRPGLLHEVTLDILAEGVTVIPADDSTSGTSSSAQ